MASVAEAFQTALLQAFVRGRTRPRLHHRSPAAAISLLPMFSAGGTQCAVDGELCTTRDGSQIPRGRTAQHRVSPSVGA
ncbi:hypothetical protein N7539_004319 [Penicillium diatomitis]|uniref:Uncharacterized protein n=1 Tax=Penicillium diatomitis TaxID=2819901 RepID=A0A9W9XDK6_9EURO|nr:uncharacterized protein N7539_004319 [Penicillium diatomitis]KAJ5489429.1 hypothetical protein N7539_004319 [Penicillium diatomitis]